MMVYGTENSGCISTPSDAPVVVVTGLVPDPEPLFESEDVDFSSALHASFTRQTHLLSLEDFSWVQGRLESHL
jgi:hypothetical protein